MIRFCITYPGSNFMGQMDRCVLRFYEPRAPARSALRYLGTIGNKRLGIQRGKPSAERYPDRFRVAKSYGNGKIPLD